MMLTPLPMLTSRHGRRGEGCESYTGAYSGGSADGRGSGSGDGAEGGEVEREPEARALPPGGGEDEAGSGECRKATSSSL